MRALGLITVALAVGTAWSQTSPPVGAVLQLLRAGGYVIVFRHGATHNDQSDTDPLNLVQRRQTAPAERHGSRRRRK